MKFQGFVGPAYTLKSVNVDCQRAVNLVPELIESGTGKEASTIYYKSSEGLEKIAEVGVGPIRLVHMDLSGQVIVVSGKEVYRLIKTAAGVESIFPVKIGDIGENDIPPAPIVDPTLQVKAVSGYDALTAFYWTIIVDGSWQNYYYSHDVTYFAEVFKAYKDFTPTPYVPVSYSQFVDYLDGYIVHLSPAQNKFYTSSITDPFSVSALSFATAEGNPDRSISMLVINRLLYIFNERSIEVYSNVGNADFPLERVTGGYIEVGCLAPYSTAKIDSMGFFLGRTENGQGIVYVISGLSEKRISTHAIEAAISKYARPDKAVGYAYSRDGHSYYILNFDEATWVYDLSTGMWHEKAYTNEDGDLERHRVNDLFFRDSVNSGVTSNYFNKYFCGDYETNKVYLLKPGHYEDDGAVLTRMRIAPHVSAQKKNVFHNSFEIDMETGVGIDGLGLGSNPQIMMTYSDDGGHTWSSEAWTSLGQTIGGIGEYKTRVQWRRLGCSRDRVYKVVVTDPVNVTIIDADLEIEAGRS